MYTTGETLSRGMIAAGARISLRNPVQGQNLSGQDGGTVQVVSFADLRDSQIEMICYDAESIAFSDSIMENRGTAFLIIAAKTVRGSVLTAGPRADFKGLSFDNGGSS